MLIQIVNISGELVRAIEVDADPIQDVIVYWPCAYCSKLIRTPKKYCSRNCTSLYSYHRIGESKN